MAWMIVDAELLAKDLSHPFQSPEFVRKAMGHRSIQQDIEEPQKFLFSELGGTSRYLLGGKSFLSRLVAHPNPPVYRGQGCSDLPGDFGRFHSLIQQSNGTAPTLFQGFL